MKADIVKVDKEVNKQTVELAITYKGNPVANYDYTYNDGRGYSNIIGAISFSIQYSTNCPTIPWASRNATP